MTETSFTKTIRVDGQGMAIHCGLPAGAGRHPALVVIQHAPGVDTFVHVMVERLNRAGYAAVAPDLYHRQRDEGTPIARMDRLKDMDLIADVNATVHHLRTSATVDPERIGLIGFCMGGRIAYLMAAVNRHLQAVVVYYGGNIMKPWGAGVPAPFALTAEIGCPILFHFGDEDDNPSPDDRRKLDAELTGLDKPHEFHVYPDAGHAFMNFTNAERYRDAAAALSWQRTLEFLKQHLTQ